MKIDSNDTLSFHIRPSFMISNKIKEILKTWFSNKFKTKNRTSSTKNLISESEANQSLKNREKRKKIVEYIKITILS